MLVILDTTEIYDCPNLDSPDFKMLQSFLSSKPAKFVVPQVVVQEMVNHYRERLAATISSARDKLRALHVLTPSTSEVTLPEIDVEAAAQEYQVRLHKRLKTLGAEVINYDEIEVAVLIERALKRRKPFDSKGHAGFRDAVLWESTLRKLKDTPDTAVIVSGNTKDFGVHGTLAYDLAKDLEAIGLSGECVTMCAGLGKFVEEYVKPHLEKLKQIQDQIEKGEYTGFTAASFYDDLHHDIQWEVQNYFQQHGFGPFARGIPRIRRAINFHLADYVAESRVEDVWNVNDDEIAVGLTYITEAEMEGYRDPEYWDYEFGEGEGEYVTGNGSITLYTTVILKRDTGEVVTWELNGAELEPDSWNFRAPRRY